MIIRKRGGDISIVVRVPPPSLLSAGPMIGVINQWEVTVLDSRSRTATPVVISTGPLAVFQLDIPALPLYCVPMLYDPVSAIISQSKIASTSHSAAPTIPLYGPP